ncbi:MAG: hypothetical protein ACTHJ8_00265 [Mucilaginibacter sp.]
MEVNIIRHIRIKIFNSNGEKSASIEIPYVNINDIETINDLKAETINYERDSIKYTPINKNNFYIEKLNKYVSVIKFAFPSVKPGSIIEFEYRWHSKSPQDIPRWQFENNLPTRYNQMSYMYELIKMNTYVTKRLPFAIDTSLFDQHNKPILNSHVWAMVNVPSVKKEPYMSPAEKNRQSVTLARFAGIGIDYSKLNILKNELFGGQMDANLTIGKKDKFIDSVKALNDYDKKIEYVFNRIKTNMSWDGINYCTATKGVEKAWKEKTGNSTEINLVLYNFLQQAGIRSYPMLISTRDHGAIDTSNLSLSSFNKTVVYVPLADSSYYVLDASKKRNVFNIKPTDALNTWGIIIDEFSNNKAASVKRISATTSSLQQVYVDAEIKPDGTLAGTSTVTNYNYNRLNELRLYDYAGKDKYIDSIKRVNHNLKIISFKQENVDDDTLPLVQSFNFEMNLSDPDPTYIYINPNLFSSLQTNPFIKEDRSSDIDMAYCSNYKLFGTYKIPQGYMVTALPKAMTLTMPDKSITFNRLVSEENNNITVRYTITHKRSYYAVGEYGNLYQFYKQLNEMLNEQIVLKKS